MVTDRVVQRPSKGRVRDFPLRKPKRVFDELDENGGGGGDVVERWRDGQHRAQ